MIDNTSVGARAPDMDKGRKTMKKRMAFLLLVVCMTLGMAFSLSACGDDEAEGGSAAEPAKASLAPGEVRYSGHTSYQGIEDLGLSFVLAADKSSIHDITFNVNGLKASKSNNGVTTEISVDSFITSVVSDIPVDYSGVTEKIDIQESALENLRFEGDKAYADLSYSYVSFNAGGGVGGMDVYPFGTSAIELTAEEAE